MQTIAPGANILVRDETWRVRRTQTTSSGQQAIHCIGISELVRDKDAIFIRELEERIGQVKLLEPETTKLVNDDSPGFRNSLLYMESLLRDIPPTDDDLHVGHLAAMDTLEYQLEPALLALEKPRQRMLIADAVGLGKTLECGILLSELIKRGRGKRILVVAIKSMLTQFQKELWSRFTIPLVRLDSIGLQRIRQNIPTNQNPFYHFDKTIISVDTLKQNNEYRVHLENAYWDVIVIDEAHNVAPRGKNISQRAELAELLSHRSDSLIMLSATPHDGKPESFAGLMNMLDPTAIADPSDYTPEEIDGLFIRRFKRDIASQTNENFPKRKIYKGIAEASDAEESAYQALLDLELHELKGRRSGHMLFKTTLEKALLSSPAACLETINNRLKRMEKDDPERYEKDSEALRELSDTIIAIKPWDFSKYQKLVDLLENDEEFKFTGWARDDRLVIFTERIETMFWLRNRLMEDLDLDERKVEVLHGGLSDVDQQRIVEEFGQHKADIRLLIASDVASEGINLHYQCHRMVHFDIPWSLMVFRQRNGRIDRYGQTNKPLIMYLYTESENEQVRGDTRVLELLIDRDEQATENIGDPSALQGVYDIDAEERLTAEAIESGDVDAFEDSLSGDTFDPLEFMLRGASKPTASDKTATARTHRPLSIFPDNFTYVRQALDALGNVDFEEDEDRKLLRIKPTDDLLDRYDLLPDEIAPEKDFINLSEDLAVMKEQIEEARSEESAWPTVDYLWPLNPVVDWVDDRMSGLFGRHCAPIIDVGDRLEADETVFLVSALIPNQKSHPLIHRWFSVYFRGDAFDRVEAFEKTISRLDLGGRTALINSGTEFDAEPLERLLEKAVVVARTEMDQEHDEFRKILNDKLDAELIKLGELEERQKANLEQRYEGKTSARDIANKDREARRIERVFEEYAQWVNDTLSTEDQPFIQIISCMVS